MCCCGQGRTGPWLQWLLQLCSQAVVHRVYRCVALEHAADHAFQALQARRARAGQARWKVLLLQLG